MGRALSLALVIASAGCRLDNPSYDTGGSISEGSATSGSGGASAASASASGETSGAASTSGAATDASAGSTTMDATTSGDPTATTAATASTDTTGSGDEVYPVKSCAELLEYLKGAELPTLSGIYEINHPTLPQETVRVYCDLVTAGGGWLLVGRSHKSGAKGNFGWRSQTGSVSNDEAPYSLGLHLYPFAVNELLIGDYSAGKTWGSALYLVTPPAGFLDLKMSAEPVILVETILGDCQSPAMLANIGHTELTGAFFLRNTTVYDGADYGLLHDQLWTYYDEKFTPEEQCDLGGLLSNKDGMVMIR